VSLPSLAGFSGHGAELALECTLFPCLLLLLLLQFSALECHQPPAAQAILSTNTSTHELMWSRCGAERCRRWQRQPLDPERRPWSPLVALGACASGANCLWSMGSWLFPRLSKSHWALDRFWWLGFARGEGEGPRREEALPLQERNERSKETLPPPIWDSGWQAMLARLQVRGVCVFHCTCCFLLSDHGILYIVPARNRDVVLSL
jgi:hypothetical protein